MRKLSVSDIWPIKIYEGVRQEFRQRVIAHKKARRVTVGSFMTFVFEDRLTVKFQIQEILRAENVTDPAAVAEEIEAFSEMLPGPGELSATLLIESKTEQEAVSRLASLVGLKEKVFFEVGEERVPAQFDPGRENTQKVSAVQYLRFSFSAKMREAFLAGAPARLVIEHPNYREALALEGALRQSLENDLREEV